jgi:hypothetical protein
VGHDDGQCRPGHQLRHRDPPRYRLQPRRAEVPEEVEPGSYRICDVMSGDENICTPITIND